MNITELKKTLSSSDICDSIEKFLDSKKAMEILAIDLRNKSSIADFMIIASGQSQRHIQSLGELLKTHLHKIGIKPVYIEGTPQSDWILIDAGDIIIHLFRPEVRSFYNLEKMWGVDLADFSRKALSEK